MSRTKKTLNPCSRLVDISDPPGMKSTPLRQATSVPIFHPLYESFIQAYEQHQKFIKVWFRQPVFLNTWKRSIQIKLGMCALNFLHVDWKSLDSVQVFALGLQTHLFKECIDRLPSDPSLFITESIWWRVMHALRLQVDETLK
jgi:hypothetical protein